MTYLKLYGEQLVAQGYAIVPLPPGSKGPRKPGWQKLTATAAMVRRWTANGSAQDGIGVLAAHSPAIDVDILDPVIAGKLCDRLETLFGSLPHIRVGQTPKFLLPFRTDTPFKKITSSVYIDTLTKVEHHIEVLGDGQQWVAYHEHPDTHQPYQWVSGGLLETPHAELPLLTLELAQAAVDAFENLAQDLVLAGQWELKQTRHTAPPTPFTNDPLTNWKPGIDFKTLKSALSKIPNRGRDELDYDTWRNVIFAIHHETQGQEHGRQLAQAWSARASKHNPEFLDQRVWPYIHDNPSGITGLTLLKLAGQYGWKKDAPPRTAPDEAPWPQYEWSAYQQDFAATSWLIKGVLPRAEFGVVYGASGSGKTFFVLDLAAAVASGESWRGHKTAAQSVVYIAAEAAEGIKKRLAAYDREHKHGPRPRIMPGAPNFLSSEDAEAVIESTQRHGGAGLIVIDTMAATHTGDENSARDMGLFIGLCKEVSRKTGAMVLVVHHTGKEDSKGLRGSSSIFAAADVVLEVFKNDDLHAARVTKQKEGETGQEFGFTLSVVEVGTDSDGDPITTCVVRPDDRIPSKKAGENRLSGLQKMILDTFDRCRGLDEVTDKGLTEEEIIEAIWGDQDLQKVPRTRGYNLRRGIRRLVEDEVFYKVADKLNR